MKSGAEMSPMQEEPESAEINKTILLGPIHLNLLEICTFFVNKFKKVICLLHTLQHQHHVTSNEIETLDT